MASEWYEPGLKFECTMCGACCSGGEGVVHFTDEEGEVIAKRLGMSVAQFREKFTRMTPLGQSLNEVMTKHGLDCVFLDRATMPGKAVCSLYEARPTQCRTFPFWPEHIRTPRAWRELGHACEGVGRGVVVPIEAIRIDRDRQRQSEIDRM